MSASPPTPPLPAPTAAPGRRPAMLSALLAALSFPSAFFGPVFQMELRVAGRRRSTYIARAVYPLILLAIVAIAFSGMLYSAYEHSPTHRIQELQRLAPGITTVIGWCQLIMLALAAPMLTSPCICDEKRARTLPSLMTTPLTGTQIIFGKLSSRMAQVLLLAFMSTPLLLAVRVFGGVDAEVIVAFSALSLTTALFAASLGLLYSVWHRRAVIAGLFAILTLGLFTLLPIILVITSAVSNTGAQPPFYLFYLSGATAMGAASVAANEPTAGFSLRHAWVVGSSINLGLTVLACFATVAALRRVLRAEAEGGLSAAEPRRRARRRSAAAAAPANGSAETHDPSTDAAPDAGPDAAAAEHGVSQTVGNYPVMWREIRQPSVGGRRNLIILIVTAAIGLTWLYTRVGFDDPTTHISVTVICTIVMLLYASVATTGAIAAEREARTLEVLLTTPLTEREIIFGKFAGGLRRAWFAAAVLAVNLAIAVLGDVVHPIAAPLLIAAIVPAAVLYCGLGTFFSVYFRRATYAAVCNLGITLSLWIGLPISIGLVQEFFRLYQDPTIELVRAGAIFANPVFLAGTIIDGTESRFNVLRTDFTFDVINHRFGLGWFSAVLAIAAVIHLAIGIGAALAAARLLARRRSSNA